MRTATPALLFAALFIIGAGCREPMTSTPRGSADQTMAERITFETSDGVTIVGDYYAGPSGAPTALLLHMRPATRESWKEFAGKLVAQGFSALAIDLRGHGESIHTKDGRTLNYQTMSEAAERESFKDLEAATLWLEREHGVAPEELVVIGASIGANLALQYLAEDNATPAAVLLSPGLDYRGIETLPLLEELESNQAVFYVAAKDDEESAESIEALAEKTAVAHEKRIFDRGGHGTTLFTSQPALIEEIIRWLKERV